VPRPTLSKRAAEILEVLARTYPDAHCELDFTNPLELLMATILSAQCTDVRVNQVTRRLFARCRTTQDYASIPQDELEALVQPTGFFRAKARHLQQCAISLLQLHDGEVPRSLEALTGLSGVGRKTANVVLGDAFGTPEGVVVDTHVQRLSRRLGLSKHSAPEKIELDLMRLVPKEHWARLSHWLIWHGRRRCDARKPDCAGCELAALCPSAGQNASNIGRKAHSKSGASSPKKRSKRTAQPRPGANPRVTP
jgi:endonuclease-3